MSELVDLRDQIDALDSELIALIGKRFGCVDQVIAVKRANRISAVVPDRIEAVVAHVRELAQAHGIPSDTVEKLWRLLIAETIAYEEKNL